MIAIEIDEDQPGLTLRSAVVAGDLLLQRGLALLTVDRAGHPRVRGTAQRGIRLR